MFWTHLLLLNPPWQQYSSALHESVPLLLHDREWERDLKLASYNAMKIPFKGMPPNVPVT
jgi:hypothetical protein